jgi:transcription antitermination factor NusG
MASGARHMPDHYQMWQPRVSVATTDSYTKIQRDNRLFLNTGGRIFFHERAETSRFVRARRWLHTTNLPGKGSLHISTLHLRAVERTENRHSRVHPSPDVRRSLECGFLSPVHSLAACERTGMGLRMAEPYVNHCSEAGIGVLSPGLASLQWYAVQTRPRHEQMVAAQLDRDGVEVLLPVETQVRRWSDRRKLIQVPVFPNYVFVRIELNDQRVYVLRRTGVIGFVGPNREATPISQGQMENVRTLMGTRVEFHSHPYLTVGQRVRIRSGALKGLEGILLRITADEHLVLSIDLINRSVIVCIAGYDLEVV